MNVGGDLKIESEQDSQYYDEKYTSGGLSINVDLTKPKKPGVGIGGGASSGKTNSDYESVTDQSGIYAGEGGFDITVDKNTDLKGGIIDSDATPDKNKLTTGTLTWEDIENKTEYSSKSDGFSGSISQNKDKNGKVHTNTVGGPEKGIEVSDEASSTTKAGVAEGTIEITDKENQKQNIEELNRDTKDSLNALGKIFDEQEVQERREMANLFSQMAHSAIGDMTLKLTSEQKAMLNIAAGALTSYFASGDFLSGAAGVATTEALQNILRDIKDPTVKQIIVSMAASAAAKAADLNTHNSSAIASDVEKFNHLNHEQQEAFVRDMQKAETNEERYNNIVYYYNLSQENRDKDPKAAEAMEKALMNELEQITKFDNGGISFVVDHDKGLHQNLEDAKAFFGTYNVVKYLPDVFGEGVKLTAATLAGPATVIGGTIKYGDLVFDFVGSYNEQGEVNDKFISSVVIDVAKATVFNKIDKLISDKVPAFITIPTEAGLMTYVNKNIKDYKDEMGD